MKRKLLCLFLLSTITIGRINARHGGAIAGGVIGGFAAGALVGHLLTKHRAHRNHGEHQYVNVPSNYNPYWF